MKEPFSWPNSSDSISSSGMAAQLTSIMGRSARGEAAWIDVGDHLLAGAVLAGDQDPGVGGGGQLDLRRISLMAGRLAGQVLMGGSGPLAQEQVPLLDSAG